MPYKFFSNSPNSINFPLAKSFSNALRLTKWYSYPFRSCSLAALVVSVPEGRHSYAFQSRDIEGCGFKDDFSSLVDT